MVILSGPDLCLASKKIGVLGLSPRLASDVPLAFVEDTDLERWNRREFSGTDKWLPASLAGAWVSWGLSNGPSFAAELPERGEGPRPALVEVSGTRLK